MRRHEDKVALLISGGVHDALARHVVKLNNAACVPHGLQPLATPLELAVCEIVVALVVGHVEPAKVCRVAHIRHVQQYHFFDAERAECV